MNEIMKHWQRFSLLNNFRGIIGSIAILCSINKKQHKNITNDPTNPKIIGDVHSYFEPITI